MPKTLAATESENLAGKRKAHYYIPENLVRAVRVRAAHEVRPMSEVVIDALELYFKHHPEATLNSKK